MESLKPKIKKLRYSPNKLKEMQLVLESNIPDSLKKIEIKRISKSNVCQVCWSIPFYEVVTKLEGASRIERYCTECFKKRKKNESQYCNPADYFQILPKKQWPDYLEKNKGKLIAW